LEPEPRREVLIRKHQAVVPDEHHYTKLARIGDTKWTVTTNCRYETDRSSRETDTCGPRGLLACLIYRVLITTAPLNHRRLQELLMVATATTERILLSSKRHKLTAEQKSNLFFHMKEAFTGKAGGTRSTREVT
jgi:hypothetical protein